ncbi:MAG: L-histidine N(alpha)-methyltransferase [Methylotenera sp.]|nr:L-histidine N(alpha)-methyltransferase [Oligoflexia bacterium]
MQALQLFEKLEPEFALIDLNPKVAEFACEVIKGLRLSQKRISPKFFYDQKGSELFEKICETEEYYVTRLETALLKKHAAEICRHLDGMTLIELGSGASEKIRILLRQIRELVAYVPVDISKSFLLESAARLQKDFQELSIIPVCADFTLPVDLPALPQFQGQKAAFFPGSTIGNFDPQDATLLLKRIGQMVGVGGHLLIGVDLVKPLGVLEAAYNDSHGVTRDFNLNLLARMNTELDADFDLQGFAHRAFFSEEFNRIEMHLVSLKDQSVTVGESSFEFRKEETIHTECSYKYTRDRFLALARSAGFELKDFWTDPDLYFGEFLLEFRPQASAGLKRSGSESR